MNTEKETDYVNNPKHKSVIEVMYIKLTLFLPSELPWQH